ncbi:uncharacterized protein G2W53_044043 [Senna tora]|uniref:Uncharacterized protein n=1 Tax=Senna tora TaxID=362788 RepID=A0A834SPW7_9FABA|nr:uncharacterized protein G2W53_044043 [Senna tora]
MVLTQRLGSSAPLHRFVSWGPMERLAIVSQRRRGERVNMRRRLIDLESIVLSFLSCAAKSTVQQ